MKNITELPKKKKDVEPKKVAKLAVTASVCGGDAKLLRVYVDEDLKLESQIIACNLQPAPTKGRQMSEYKTFHLSFDPIVNGSHYLLLSVTV